LNATGPRRVPLWGAIGCLVALAAWGGAPRPREVDAAPEFVFVGINMFAAAQPTSEGQRVRTLQGWRNELYMGYGDYEANTGPIEIAAWDPRRRAFSPKLLFNTEMVALYRVIGDRLYAPAIDPRGAGQSASVAIGEASGSWRSNSNAFFTHAYDIATLDGSDLWLVGSQGREALAARSIDGGQTWTTALTVSASNPDDIARFYFVFAHRGRLVVQAEGGLGPHPHSKIFANGTWTDGPDLQALPAAGCKPLPVAGKIVYRGRSALMAYDGTSAWPIGPAVQDLIVDGRWLYVLSDGGIRRTTDLSRWTAVAAAPPGPSSLGVLDGDLYVGTAHASLYRLDRRSISPARR
jgi:hypothetical protein